jgi:hypothetical protein
VGNVASILPHQAVDHRSQGELVIALGWPVEVPVLDQRARALVGLAMASAEVGGLDRARTLAEQAGRAAALASTRR